MTWFSSDSSLCTCVCVTLALWWTHLVLFVIVPAVLGVSFGIRSFYMRTLLKVFKWATSRIETGAKEKNEELYKPDCTGKSSDEMFHVKSLTLARLVGIIAKGRAAPLQELRSTAGSDFELADVLYFSRRGAESIVDDEVTRCFSAQELETWNLLTRSNYNFRHISVRVTALWGLGVLLRYTVILSYTQVIHHQIDHHAAPQVIHSGQTLRENKPQNGGICVANHTTPIDVIILANDGCYSLVGQVHRGLMGVLQRAMVKASSHIWFERSEAKDRHLVAKRLGDHVADKNKLPILIFPEGTCVNNTSVMMFKKGSFEVDCTIYPVAIKYDPRFGDAFWNSSKFGIVSYLLRMMSSWAIVCSVWYLPPMNREEGESAVEFANRVKSAIASQGGLVDLVWDGGLKRAKVKEDFKKEQQKLYSKVLVGDTETEK
uniref:Phospholipid/glycerol acyltransferase domain-containing protein n=1 Tax=Periophthalmus magnuspinnatus TaxID=409849 RepID=A0A3B3ZLL6_9GOBI